MKKIIQFKFLLVTILLCRTIIACAQVKHVVLISIDGLQPAMYLDKSWPAPNLRELMKKGTYADHMLSVFPSYTYPSHTAMLTGALPARSGICYNAPIGSRGDWNWFVKDIRVPILWQVLKKAGMSTSAVEWPVSVSPDITYNIPEIWNNDHPDDRITEARKYATPGLVDEIERNATGRLDSINMDENNFSMDANSARMAAYIFKKYKPALLAVHFAEVDGKEHDDGRDADSVRLALAAADQDVGMVLEAIRTSKMQDSTIVIVVGDHGFCTIRQAIFPNAWLKAKDLHDCFFEPAGGSAFLYLRDPKNTVLLDSVKNAIKSLPDSIKTDFRVIEKAELEKMGGDKDALMALAAKPGIIFGGNANRWVISVTGGHHGYDPSIPDMYTGFIAVGPGIIKGGHIKDLCVTDIAPLIAKLLGIEFNAPDGKLVQGILK